MQEYVCGFMFSEDRNRFLLIEKNRPAWQKGKLNGIGGKIESDETFHEAMIREFEKETGIQTKEEEWSLLAELFGKDFIVIFFYCFSDKIKDAFSKTDEKVYTIKVSNAVHRKVIMPNLKVLIPLALDQSGIKKPVELYETSLQ